MSSYGGKIKFEFLVLKIHVLSLNFNLSNYLKSIYPVGVVLDVGRKVSHVEVGDTVWSAQPIACNGTLSEFVVIDGNSVRLKPVHLSHDGAATLPYSR